MESLEAQMTLNERRRRQKAEKVERRGKEKTKAKKRKKEAEETKNVSPLRNMSCPICKNSITPRNSNNDNKKL